MAQNVFRSLLLTAVIIGAIIAANELPSYLEKVLRVNNNLRVLISIGLFILIIAFVTFGNWISYKIKSPRDTRQHKK